MIIYFDVLLIDEESLLGIKNRERFRRLREIVTCRKGYAELVPRTVISTSQSAAAPTLRELFAQCIASRGEGLVLKPNEPYFDFNIRNRNHGCFNIKLKKEYIQGWGDVGDFAVVGASYDAAKAKEYRMPNVKWTHFFIGCLENKHQARAKTEMPRFRVTNFVELTGPTLSSFWAQHRVLSVPCKDNTSFELDYSRSMLAKRPTDIFPTPLVFDMRCFAFDKEPNNNFWSMRFPQVAKVHYDRSYLDTIGFAELQEIAEAAANTPEEADSQEMRYWVQALEKIDRRALADVTSQATTCSEVVPSSPSSVSSESSESSQASVSYQATACSIKPDLPAPLTSSVVDSTESGTESDSNSSTISTPRHAKRCTTEQSGSKLTAKRRCTYSPASSQQAATPSSPMRPTRTRHREPLSQVNTNVSEHPVESQARKTPLSSSAQSIQNAGVDIENQPAPSSPTIYHTASEMRSSPSKISETRRHSTINLSQGKTSNLNHAQCSLASRECLLADCSILLAPCISSYAWVTDNLLTQHGIIDPLLDPRVWNALEPPKGTSTATGLGNSGENQSTVNGTPGRRKVKARRVRKICLVESRRKEATDAFLEKIKAADLKKKNCEHEWVAVYDWRVLETITELEAKETEKSAHGGTDPWRKFYVGIV